MLRFDFLEGSPFINVITNTNKKGVVDSHNITSSCYYDGSLPRITTTMRHPPVDPSGYWWPPTYSTWTPTTVSFNFFSFLNCSIIYYFWQFFMS